MIISMEYKDINGVLVWISQKDSSVAPFSLFISFFSFFYFLYFFVASMALSIQFSFVLFGIFYCVHFAIFSSLKGNTLFYKKVKEIFHTLQGTQNHKEYVTIMMYAMYVAASVTGTCMT